jgi:hypothetical protein
MRRILPLLFTLLPALASACDRPVCIIDPTALHFGRIITFDDQPGNFGPGLPIDGLLILPGASFGERFAGQNLTAEGDFDLVTGAALPPLTPIPGAPGQTFSILRITGASLLSGTGPGGFPMNVANGEGAVAILFDGDQSVLRLDLRGGEGGVAHIMFLSRDGAIIDQIDLTPLTEGAFGFARNATVADIAGLVISNHDPEGIALDAVAFDGGEQTSRAEITPVPSGSG